MTQKYFDVHTPTVKNVVYTFRVFVRVGGGAGDICKSLVELYGSKTHHLIKIVKIVIE